MNVKTLAVIMPLSILRCYLSMTGIFTENQANSKRSRPLAKLRDWAILQPLTLRAWRNTERMLPFMAGKIFYRERRRYADGAGTPRYLLMAVQGVNLKVYGQHLRLSELKAIADATGAELVADDSEPANFQRDSWGREARTLETLLIQAADKAQFLISADDADEEILLSDFTEGERELFISLLTKFVEGNLPKNWIC